MNIRLVEEEAEEANTDGILNANAETTKTLS